MYTDEMIAKVMGCSVAQLRAPAAKAASKAALRLIASIEQNAKIGGRTTAQLLTDYRDAFRKAYK